MERIKLNLIPSGVAPIVHLSQYDDGRKFGIDLFEGESVYVLDGTETLTVNSRKPDGHVVTLAVTNTGTSSVDVDTIEQLTAVHGLSYAKLQIVKGSVTIATLPFLIDVSRDPLENGDPSESFIQNLRTQIADGVAEEVAEQYDSANVIFDAVPTSGHGNGYVVTSEGVKTEVDNLNTALAGKVDTTDFFATNLPISSGDPTNTKDYIDGKTASANYSINNLDFYRSGNVVFFNIIAGTNSTDASGFIVSGGSNLVIRQGYRPPNNVNVLDTVSGNRMTCNADGTVWTGRTSQSGQSFRISACWITNDAFPT